VVLHAKRTPPIAQNRTKNQAALGLLGKAPSVLQSILPLQAQRETLLPILRVEPTTFHFGLDNFLEFYRREGELTDWATLTRLLRKGVVGMTIWC
jgi:hypothetical protein